MKKEFIFGAILILLFILSVILGAYVYKIKNTQESNIIGNVQLTEIYKESDPSNNIIYTSSSEERISPNCTIIEKQYFKDCDHLIREVKEVDEKLINCTQEELEKEYNGWSIEEFNNNQVILYKENSGYCPEHYIIKENNGVLAIYTIDENGVETFQEDTEIQTMYLPEEDIEKFKQGMQIIGTTRLHSVLQDFE